MIHPQQIRGCLLACCCFSLLGHSAATAQSVSFNRDIRRILADRCFHCHGPSEGNRQAELRLDRADGDDGAYRTLDDSTAIKPGSPTDSVVWNRITSEDPDQVMPPPDSHKKPLSPGEKQQIRQWIEEGAEYENFRAFVPPQKPAKPHVNNRQWSNQEIDLFVLRRLVTCFLMPVAIS